MFVVEKNVKDLVWIDILPRAFLCLFADVCSTMDFIAGQRDESLYSAFSPPISRSLMFISCHIPIFSTSNAACCVLYGEKRIKQRYSYEFDFFLFSRTRDSITPLCPSFSR